MRFSVRSFGYALFYFKEENINMNMGAFGIIGVGIFVFIGGYLSEDKELMMVAGAILLWGFGVLTAKPAGGKNPTTGQVYFRCPNCKRNAGERF